jgi:CheY-like chemotaxis protein
MLVGAYLRHEPYQLDFAVDGKEAIEKFTAQRYNLVFMDIQMPEVDGLTATRTIRQWEQDQGRAPTPIIALTAFALEEDVQRILAAGCNAHLAKPVKKRMLLDAICNAALMCNGKAPAGQPAAGPALEPAGTFSSPRSLAAGK